MLAGFSIEVDLTESWVYDRSGRVRRREERVGERVTNHRIDAKVPKLNPSKAQTWRLPPVSHSIPRRVTKRAEKEAVIAFTNPLFVPGTNMDEMTSSTIDDLAAMVDSGSIVRKVEKKKAVCVFRLFATWHASWMVGSTSNELLSLAQTLSASLDPNAQVRESATTQLQSLAINWPGFYPSLIELVANKSFDLGSAAQEIRLQAILQFKNGVERYWRKGSSAAIAPQIKAELRPRLLEMVTEENQLVSDESRSFPIAILTLSISSAR